MHLSVIIPTLNKLATANLIAERIRLLLPALKIEVIIVIPFAIQESTLNELLRYVTDARRGVYMAYNAGLRMACGEYVWFMGDDDYPLDSAIAICEHIQEGTADLLVAPVLFSSGRLYRPTHSLLALHFLNWCQQGVIYRRHTLLRHRFFRKLTVKADQYVNIRLRSDSTVKIKFLADPICMFGVNGLSGQSTDAAYDYARMALARRTLGCVAFLIFRALVLLEPAIKRMLKIRA